MQPLRSQAQEKHTQLLQAVNLTAEEMQSLSDRIQKRVKAAPDLTVLCEFSATIQMRRLLQVPPGAWQVLEVRWAEQMLAKLETLKKQKGQAATLALACLGFQRGDLQKALLAAGVAPLPLPHAPAETSDPMIKPLALGPDEELDPAMQAAPDALNARTLT